MPEQTEPIRLEDCSPDDIIVTLLSGEAIAGGHSEIFSLSNSDSTKIFAYYTQHRDLWPRNRQVQATEINGLLEALGSELPEARRPTHPVVSARPIWNLRRIEAHRFGGLHRHCGPGGEDPEPFVLEIDKDLTLISGFNGAGKTALLSSVVWCLTGKALRSQHMPDEVHEPITWEWVGAEEAAEDGPPQRDVAIPPIVPIPSGSDLEALADQPKLDTWVRLTFRNDETGESRSVIRRLVTQPGRRITMRLEGLEELGLSRSALEAGTLMPGVAANMRFDEKTDFAHAIAQLTGLKPLEDLGKRSRRVISRLRRGRDALHRSELCRKTSRVRDEEAGACRCMAGAAGSGAPSYLRTSERDCARPTVR
jgi:AAA domain